MQLSISKVLFCGLQKSPFPSFCRDPSLKQFEDGKTILVWRKPKLGNIKGTRLREHLLNWTSETINVGEVKVKRVKGGGWKNNVEHADSQKKLAKTLCIV